MLKITIKPNRDVEPSLVSKQTRLLGRPIEAGSIIYDNGEPLIIFGRFGKPHVDFKKWLPQVKYQNNQRLTRLNNNYDNQRSHDLSFGFRTQRPVFNLAAGALLGNHDHPTAYALGIDLGKELLGKYAEFNPNKHDFHQRQAETTHERWRIPGTPFTQFIINNTVSLDYHYDRGNIEDCWSCMAVFSRDVIGGELVLPALDAHLKIEDETYVFFNGQKLLHGVAPIKKISKYGARFSVVYFTIDGMDKLGTYDEEIKKMRQSDMVKHKKNKQC